MNWYFEALKKYIVSDGRARRKEYWYFFLINLFILVVLDMLASTLPNQHVAHLVKAAAGLYILATFIPSIAVGIRRLHDTNRSAWWWLLNFVPIVGPLVLLFLLAQKGTTGANRYGDDPKDENYWQPDEIA